MSYRGKQGIVNEANHLSNTSIEIIENIIPDIIINHEGY